MALNVVGYTDSRLSERPSIYNGGKTDTNVVNVDNENNIIYVNSSKLEAKDKSIELIPGEYTHRDFSNTEIAVKINDSASNRLKLTDNGLYVGTSSETEKQADWDMLDTEDSSYINNKPFQKIGDTLTVSEDSVLDVTKPFQVDIEKVEDYLYNIRYDVLDYNYAKDYFLEDKDEDVEVGACSALRKDNLFGRQLDWLYDNQVEFVVKTPASNERHAVYGVASNIPKLTKDFVESRRWDEIYKILPFRLVDGINDAGLVCCSNVVPCDKGKTNGTIPTEEKLDEVCSSMLTKYILDNFSTAEEAVDYIQRHVSVYVPKRFHDLGYETHLMVADKNSTYAIEFVNNAVVALDIKDYPFITNFYLYDMYRNEDGSVYTPANQDEEHNAVLTNHITVHGAGLERYNLINENINSIDSVDKMGLLLDKLNYTNTYKRDTEPFWYTEYLHDDLVVNSPIDQFTQTVDFVIGQFEERTRDNPLTWQTVHSSIYDIENKTLVLQVQEKNIDYNYCFNYYTKHEADENLKAVYDELDSRLKSEEAARRAADNQLNQLLSAEIERAEIEENRIQEELDSEISRAQSAEDLLTNNLNTEINRAKAEEEKLQQEIDNIITQDLSKEIQDRKEADEKLQAAIDAEKERAENAESSLNVDLETEIARAKEAENTLSLNLSEEAQTRESADNKLTEDLASEVERAQNKESELNTAIETEKQRAIKAESDIEDAIESLNTDLDIEIARASNKEDQIEADLTLEISRAKEAEKLLTDNLTAEITAREQADNGLSQSISTEILNRTNADNALDEKITAEVNRATQKEGNLQEALNSEITRATQAESTLTTNLAQEVSDRKQAITSTENKITAEETRAQGVEAELLENIESVSDRVETIEGKIPNQASAENQLADKEFVNSSISTNTANFIGTFSSVEELNQYAGTKTNNDYAFVVINDETTGFVKEYDRYKWNGSQWLFEYSLNNSSFTQEQWDAVNSGATEELIDQITANKQDIASLESNKVDKIVGKQLSTEDFTTAEKEKLASLENYDDASVKADIQDLKNTKQNNLISGTNIKTINNQSLLGSGNIEIKYTQGDGISISNNQISADNTIARVDAVNTELVKKVDKVEGKSLVSDTEIERLSKVDNYDDSAVKQSLQDLGSDISELQDEVARVESEIPTNVSELNNDANYVNASELVDGLKTKEDIITDLAGIRAGAAKGATAVQDPDYVHTDNNYTTSEKQKLQGIEAGAQVNTITGIKGDSESEYRTGNVNITKADIGLSEVENTSDLNKPISTATQNALNEKQEILVSGTNIRTINNQSLLGEGDIHIEAGGDEYIPGDGIDINNSIISVKEEIARKTYVDNAIQTLTIGVSGNIPVYNGNGFEDSGAIPLYLGDEEEI